MTKLERLKLVERTFGPEFVNPYRPCYNFRDLSACFAWLKSVGEDGRAGCRTDYRDGVDQGYGLPFWGPGAPNGYATYDKLMTAHRERPDLLFLCGYSFESRINGVTWMTPEMRRNKLVFFETNALDYNVAQRFMYKNLDNLRRYYVGEQGGMWPHPVGGFLRVVKLEDVWFLGLADIWRSALRSGWEELTFSISGRDGRAVIW